MKSNGKLTHNEIMDGLTGCFRDLIAASVSDRNLPNLINKGKASAQIVTAIHREELMEAKRNGASLAIKAAEQPTLKKLKPRKGE